MERGASPAEATFLESDAPTQRQILHATQRTRGTSRFCCGQLDRMPLPVPTDRALRALDLVRDALPNLYADTADFISSAQLS